MFTFQDLIDITGGQKLTGSKNRNIRYYVTDSRRAVAGEEAIFIALKGVRYDGHDFIPDLYRRGIRQFIVQERNFPASCREGSNVLLVSSTLSALQKIAAAHRNAFSLDVVGITGSNGKTIVKEWLTQILSGKFKIVRSPKSYNSQLGVPLSVLQLKEYHNLAIIEAGISKPGEMDRLERIIRPNVGVFTNIGPAHDEGFKSRREKALEKWKLFKECDAVIYCGDHKTVHETHPRGKGKIFFNWGYSPFCDLVAGDEAPGIVSLKHGDRKYVFRIPFRDAASRENIMHCIATALYFKMKESEIQEALDRLGPISMRMEVKRGADGCVLLDDSYSNDLTGLELALDFMLQQSKPFHTVILSDILESGRTGRDLYPIVNEMLHRKNVHRLIGIGREIIASKDLLTIERKEFFRDTNAFLRDFHGNFSSQEVILVKGARIFSFERIVRRLQEKSHGTVLEINLDALRHNLDFYRSHLGTGVKTMVMVKAFAYGSGSWEVANWLQFHHVDYLAVAYVDEGIELRKRNITIPIMVMNVRPDSFEKLVEFDLEPEVFSLKQITGLAAFVKENGKTMSIHIKLDTGMHRLGFDPEDLDRLLAILKGNPALKTASIYTHLAGADEAVFDEFSHLQVKRFLRMYGILKPALPDEVIRHVLNSAGIIRFPEYQFDMVRLGIGLYGYESTGSRQEALRVVSTLKTYISQIKTLREGETVGYSRKGKLKRDSKIATIAIGYADGYARAFSNGRAFVWVKGVPAPVIGNICMDMTMIDITGIDAREGDEVVIFGEKPDIRELAGAIGTIPYEILTAVNDRVKRVFYTE